MCGVCDCKVCEQEYIWRSFPGIPMGGGGVSVRRAGRSYE